MSSMVLNFQTSTRLINLYIHVTMSVLSIYLFSFAGLEYNTYVCEINYEAWRPLQLSLQWIPCVRLTTSDLFFLQILGFSSLCVQCRITESATMPTLLSQCHNYYKMYLQVFCIDTVRRTYVFVTHGNKRV